MSSHTSPASSQRGEMHDAILNSLPSSDPDSSALSLESSFQLDSTFQDQTIDAEKHPKGRRKRTTSQDKAILESAYAANAKPDKSARLDIVKRVSLTEKEVQIWFQNRRQNDRRKSRPLSPHEIAALRYGGGMRVLTSDSASVTGIGPDLESGDKQPSSPDQVPDASPTASQDVNTVEAEQARPRSLSESNAPASPPREEEEPKEPQAFSQSVPSSIGFLSNRWNAGNSFSATSNVDKSADGSLPRFESFTSSAAESAAGSSPPSLPPPSSASSLFRLSLSLDGKAEVVSSQQSPPRPVPFQGLGDLATLPPVRAHRTLQRSRSALPGITLPPISTLTASLPAQLGRGRSRNVHAWESVAVADTRDELTTQAENESSGSAVAAISLLRSSSQTAASLSNMVHGHPSALQTSSAKRNAPPSRRDSTKKAKRMQTLPLPHSLAKLHAAEEHEASDEPEKKGGLAVVLSPSGGDSDKENWSPDEEGNPVARRRPLPSATGTAGAKSQGLLAGGNPRRVGRVLGEQGAVRRLGLGSRANTAPVPRSRAGGKGGDVPVAIFEDGEAEVAGAGQGGKSGGHGEVDKFMRGEVSPSKRPDMDCVAGLLSLSQGNWR